MCGVYVILALLPNMLAVLVEELSETRPNILITNEAQFSDLHDAQ